MASAIDRRTSQAPILKMCLALQAGSSSRF
ncbi:MAG: hypothetical protein JWP29_905 [Rhodoferax sp.]|nr:hypothetical protein [Rhodoferax sp.]